MSFHACPLPALDRCVAFRLPHCSCRGRFHTWDVPTTNPEACRLKSTVECPVCHRSSSRHVGCHLSPQKGKHGTSQFKQWILLAKQEDSACLSPSEQCHCGRPNDLSTIGTLELLNDLAATQSDITLAASCVVVLFKHVAALFELQTECTCNRHRALCKVA